MTRPPRPARPTLDLLQMAGLWGSTPEVELDRARALFATGDLGGSAAAAGSARSTWIGAPISVAAGS